MLRRRNPRRLRARRPGERPAATLGLEALRSRFWAGSKGLMGSFYGPDMNGRFHPAEKAPWLFAQSRVRSSARVNRSNNSSICDGDMTSGGHRDKVSPASERTI